jgi:hypothetical protein
MDVDRTAARGTPGRGPTRASGHTVPRSRIRGTPAAGCRRIPCADHDSRTSGSHLRRTGSALSPPLRGSRRALRVPPSPRGPGPRFHPPRPAPTRTIAHDHARRPTPPGPRPPRRGRPPGGRSAVPVDPRAVAGPAGGAPPARIDLRPVRPSGSGRLVPRAGRRRRPVGGRGPLQPRRGPAPAGPDPRGHRRVDAGHAGEPHPRLELVQPRRRPDRPRPAGGGPDVPHRGHRRRARARQRPPSARTARTHLGQLQRGRDPVARGGGTRARILVALAQRGQRPDGRRAIRRGVQRLRRRPHRQSPQRDHPQFPGRPRTPAGTTRAGRAARPRGPAAAAGHDRSRELVDGVLADRPEHPVALRLRELLDDAAATTTAA